MQAFLPLVGGLAPTALQLLHQTFERERLPKERSGAWQICWASQGQDPYDGNLGNMGSTRACRACSHSLKPQSTKSECY